ncbi:MAG: hypothetical protein ABIQ95_17135 [Bdellovibrionia bacterium]
MREKLLSSIIKPHGELITRQAEFVHSTIPRKAKNFSQLSQSIRNNRWVAAQLNLLYIIVLYQNYREKWQFRLVQVGPWFGSRKADWRTVKNQFRFFSFRCTIPRVAAPVNPQVPGLSPDRGARYRALQ